MMWYQSDAFVSGAIIVGFGLGLWLISGAPPLNKLIIRMVDRRRARRRCRPVNTVERYAGRKR